MTEFEFPCGYRFVPDDEELVLFYLRRKLNGDPIPPCPVQELDIYGDKDPWELFDKDSDDFVYVFTKLKKQEKSNVKNTRRTASGTWNSRNTKEGKDEEGNVLWFKKYFVFEVNNRKGSSSSSTDSNGEWRMYEFSLQDKVVDDYVICKIWNKEAKDLHLKKEGDLGSLQSEAALVQRKVNNVPSSGKKRKFSGQDGDEEQHRNKMQTTGFVYNDMNMVEAMPLSTLIEEHQLPQVSDQFGDFFSPSSLLLEDNEFTAEGLKHLLDFDFI